MSDESIEKHLLPTDESGITVGFYKYIDLHHGNGTAVVFRIPDHCQILSRDPHEFMRWCYGQFMEIANQAARMQRKI